MWNHLISFGFVLLQAPAVTPTPASQNGGFSSFLWLMLGIGIGIIIGVLISKAFGRSQGDEKEKQLTTLGIESRPHTAGVTNALMSRAKRCPVCKSTYTDDALIYCVSDGASLVPVNTSSSYDPDATRLSPEARHKEAPPTEVYRPNK